MKVSDIFSRGGDCGGGDHDYGHHRGYGNDHYYRSNYHYRNYYRDYDRGYRHHDRYRGGLLGLRINL
ncbi:MAG: hypothetical protein ACRDUW_09015 [Pseudonocardiaceae bacterium]|jgi:hypothetical protein